MSNLKTVQTVRARTSLDSAVIAFESSHGTLLDRHSSDINR
jgi:hypothetical protein